MKNIIKEIIKDFHNSKPFNVKKRELKIPINTGKIITLIGSRRVGKTYLLYDLINEISIKTNRKNIIYFNFEDERLDFKKEELDLILQSYFELYPDINLQECYFFFDEIQNTNNWEKFIRRIYDTITKNIFITGSSSKLLSKEIATSLRGRTLSYDVFPLNFREFLDFKEIDKKDLFSSKNKAKIKNEFETFLKGSFPEIIFFDDEKSTKTYREYLNVMIYKDIIERYNLKNFQAINFFIKKSILNISNEFSLNKFYNELKSQGLKISKDTIYNFPQYLEDIYLIFYLNKYSNSISKQEFSEKKIYVLDLGFNNLFKFSEDKGKQLENIVFLELKRKGYEIYYYKEKYECDFIIKEKEKITQVIQVSKSLKDKKTKEREVRGLLEAMKKYNLNEGLILTEDEEYTFIEQEKKIKVYPILKWILE